MRGRKLSQLAAALPREPSRPAAGDVYLLCRHRPPTHVGAFYFWLGDEGVGFTRPDGTDGRATWMVLCSSCNKRFSGDLAKAASLGRIQLTADGVWPEDMVKVPLWRAGFHVVPTN